MFDFPESAMQIHPAQSTSNKHCINCQFLKGTHFCHIINKRKCYTRRGTMGIPQRESTFSKEDKANIIYTSLSQWYPQAYLQPHVHHGEKFSTTDPNLENTANSYGSNLVMEKQFLEMDMDPTALICVNPYDVNPLIMERNMLPTNVNVDVPLKDESSAMPQPQWGMSCGDGSRKPQRKIKLEMEEFSDLSSFVVSKPTSISSIDELNTPIFDKDAFDFNVNLFSKDSQSEDIFVKLESDAIYENTCIINSNQFNKDLSLSTEKVHRNGNINSNISNILRNTDIPVFSQSENGSAYSCIISPPLFENANTTGHNVDDKSALSVNNEQYSEVSSMGNNYKQFNSGLETPEDSNSCTSHESNKMPSHLSLNIGLKANFNSDLTTPSIIEEVVDLESSNFNILDLVTNEDMTYVNAEDIFITPNSVVSNTSVDVKVSMLKQKHSIPQKRPRKRRYTDDDEDYVPPSKKTITQRKTIVTQDSDSEFDSDADIDIKPKTKARGRPPKRTESVSSDCSKDSDASKYRELRDKNNEASRKSRLKRKIKELELEKEADDLLCRNIKLKAQVEELEKMVTNFRDNLFKIMIKK
ncbi:hypothetical protein NQ315_012114 [Exocentrus adspersus]|uniref:BZIP domain-containing protein n=1 Tax=Exocentrus adspersus TaxID=1586481 RepID=A0AAV8VY25_9CUCU|nr:hypothetical protein NQ315_012114 [Exocentrus adspersus]